MSAKLSRAQERLLRWASESPVMLTKFEGIHDQWSLQNGRRIRGTTAQRLIRAGHLVASEDALLPGLSQTYRPAR